VQANINKNLKRNHENIYYISLTCIDQLSWIDTTNLERKYNTWNTWTPSCPPDLRYRINGCKWL